MKKTTVANITNDVVVKLRKAIHSLFRQGIPPTLAKMNMVVQAEVGDEYNFHSVASLRKVC